MGQNFLTCNREQELLLPPSLREWLPEGHLAWFVINAVEAMDFDAFYASYLADGHGGAARADLRDSPTRLRSAQVLSVTNGL